LADLPPSINSIWLISILFILIIKF
jgi:hypothetical protein